ncbi:S26 family signal peptidase [Micromonospora sp. NBC_01699]|uniref:S26 family signal peptidase n=1 Tax=Micromonospora sp. NBC_01699 TaxID=2975984 RepID=UPI002E315975|nr:S26 family signal peptidase [Micromonospora sp. NBC_01699]
MSQFWVYVAVAGVLVPAAVALLFVRRRLLLVSVVGRSMEPTLRAGDRVLARRARVDEVRRGDVVVVVAPAKMRPEAAEAERGLLIKRAFAVPGDPAPVDRVPALRGLPDAEVPPGHLVVLGDNPPWSYDSRECGYLTAESVLGVVIRPRLRPDRRE